LLLEGLGMISDDNDAISDTHRRTMWQKTAVRTASAALGLAVLAALTRPALATIGSRSRTDGYEIQKTEAAWKAELSEIEFFVLRQGGTERPGYSTLENEKRPGEFRCAGCGTPLFNAKDKFRSGTGWPSFARGLAGVERTDAGMLTAALVGAELRCKTCGGHLGDVFKDGFLFIGTEAAITGERYCIDGAALVFYPLDGSSPLGGDQQAPVKVPSFLEPPTIDARPKE
jgi:peptide-methionine (R)-S-oxide reductase